MRTVDIYPGVLGSPTPPTAGHLMTDAQRVTSHVVGCRVVNRPLPRPPKPFTRRRLVGVIAGLAAPSVSWIATAQADTDQDSGTNRNQGGRTAGKVNESGPSDRQGKKNSDDPAAFGSAKPPTTLRDEAEIAAAADAKMAAMFEADLKRLGFSGSPASQLAVLGPGGSVPTVGMGGLVPNARTLAAYIADTYPGVQAIGGVRADPLPDHPSGRAIDIMIGWNTGLGDAINADIQRQARRFGVVYTLWRVANHFDHVHVTVS